VLEATSFIGFIPVPDTSRVRPFYEETLGLPVIEDTPFALVVDANGTMLRITPVPDFAAQPFTIAGWRVADITATVQALVDRSVRCVRHDGMDQDDLGIWTAPGGDRVAWFKDPAGNLLSLTTFAPR
jgi:catechol 2,3-dioxygenase-like lactoylglutathione lyase family enzyme